VQHYYLLYKPFQVLSQFSPEGGKRCLKNIFDVPADVYPVGRLDYDSEGLLIVTNDKALNHRLLHPSFAHEREYWVEVEGSISTDALARMAAGISVTIDGKPYRTKPCRALLFNKPPAVPERVPPVRFRKNIPTSWIRIILTEGKNRQVRKMTAAAGYPTLRLIRYRIAGLSIGTLQPGEMMILGKNDLDRALGIDAPV
jgi:23S rRNA pseudouridine2457 synthase